MRQFPSPSTLSIQTSPSLSLTNCGGLYVDLLPGAARVVAAAAAVAAAVVVVFLFFDVEFARLRLVPAALSAAHTAPTSMPICGNALAQLTKHRAPSHATNAQDRCQMQAVAVAHERVLMASEYAHARVGAHVTSQHTASPLSSSDSRDRQERVQHSCLAPLSPSRRTRGRRRTSSSACRVCSSCYCRRQWQQPRDHAQLTTTSMAVCPCVRPVARQHDLSKVFRPLPSCCVCSHRMSPTSEFDVATTIQSFAHLYVHRQRRLTQQHHLAWCRCSDARPVAFAR